MEENIFPIRINRFLAKEGVATRRDADIMIEKGLVYINGVRAVVGQKVNEGEAVEIQKSKKRKELLYFAYNKPRGIMTHTPQNGEEEIKDLINIPGVYPVGRLDKASEGLIILTNDGRITERLLSPESEHEKEYVVTVRENLPSALKEKMEGGLDLGEYVTKKCKVDPADEHTFHITITEGKKHQIRRMCEVLFLTVTRLKRIRIGKIKIAGLRSGEYREIQGNELTNFLHELGLQS